MIDSGIEFKERVFDNVHGSIELTQSEWDIINLKEFKRLQDIKQLSLISWVFPGSEHTRYLHSIGVMHIADRISIHLKLDTYERKLIRLAGLLHDIGQYPLSHVCEKAYKDMSHSITQDNLFRVSRPSIFDEINRNEIKGPDVSFLIPSPLTHHEVIGKHIIDCCKPIRDIIVRELGEDAVEKIGNIITGNFQPIPSISHLVKIMHSEIDADGLDYMIRDGRFLGTSFGSFELDQLVRNMEIISDYNGKYKLIGIKPKGVAAADQYLINKFFTYSQVLFNKHSVIIEWMASHLIYWMKESEKLFPSIAKLYEWIKDPYSSDFLGFNDTFFWSCLRSISSHKTTKDIPPIVLMICNELLSHNELEMIKDSEIKAISRNQKELASLLRNHCTSSKIPDNVVTILSKYSMTRHIPIEAYKMKLADSSKADEEGNGNGQSSHCDEELLASRLINGTCIKRDADVHLLCDDDSSLMKQLYQTQVVFIRSYNNTL